MQDALAPHLPWDTGRGELKYVPGARAMVTAYRGAVQDAVGSYHNRSVRAITRARAGEAVQSSLGPLTSSLARRTELEHRS
jgi:hypothetical protein